MDTQVAVNISEMSYVLVVRVVNFQKNKPIKNDNIKFFKLEKEPITLKQWAENLKNGSPFKKLILTMNTDDNGAVTAELAKGFYEVQVGKYGLNKVCELKQNDSILFIEPKKHCWQ